MKKSKRKAKTTALRRPGGKKSGGQGKPAAAPAGAGTSAAEPPAAKQQRQNPYEVFQNSRRRHTVLGERVRGESRNMVRSRASALNDRTNGLLKECLSSRRTSRFKDARLGDFGDKDKGGVQRLVRVRQKQARKSFSLNVGDDAASLTHGGRPLAEFADKDLRGAGLNDDDIDEEAAREALFSDDPIARSKLQKEEAKLEQEAHEKLLGKLDGDFGDIMKDLQFRPKKAELLRTGALTKSDPDGYDRLVRELAIDKKAIATDRLKTPEEIAREQAEKLEALERARLVRADGSLADNLDVNDDANDALPKQAAGKGALDGSDAEDDDDDGDEDDEAGGEEEEDEEDGEEEDAEKSEAEDAAEEADDGRDEDDKLGEDCIPLLPARALAGIDIMANERSERKLPFAPDCPGTMRAVETLLQDQSPKTSLKVVQRIRACTAAALAHENGAKLRSFFVALLEYMVHVLARSDDDISARGMQIVYALRSPLVELANDFPDEAYTFFAGRLQAMGPNTLPRTAELSTLKLITLVFPVTDVQHPITTPAALLADHWAAALASLGVGMTDLISDAMLLWEVLYEFVMPAQRFCTSFFKLGMAVLESCWASAAAGRQQCAEAADAAAALMLQSLRSFLEADEVAARVAIEELVRPVIKRLVGSEGPARRGVEALEAELDKLFPEGGGFVPLKIFDAPPPQIKSLEPIFYEIGDRPNHRGMERSETKELQRALNVERRAAARQLSRDAAALQKLQHRQDAIHRSKRTKERTRVRTMMEVEKQELKKLKTESGGGMDTSLKRYSAGKERKQENKRLGGNATDQNRKANGAGAALKALPAVGEGAGRGGGPAKRQKGKKGGKRAKGR